MYPDRSSSYHRDLDIRHGNYQHGNYQESRSWDSRGSVGSYPQASYQADRRMYQDSRDGSFEERDFRRHPDLGRTGHLDQQRREWGEGERERRFSEQDNYQYRNNERYMNEQDYDRGYVS